MTDASTATRVRTTLASWFRDGLVAWVALATWAVGLFVGVLAVHLFDANPLTSTGVVVPLAIGIPIGLAMFGLATWLRSTWLIGVAAGGYAAWAGTTIAAALVGTPFGFGLIAGDAGRMSALVMHFSSTWHPGDAADPSLPPEYPPLYPMLVGRVAAWTGRPGWQMLQPAQIVVTSFAVVAGFILWRRLVGDVTAFLISSSVYVIMAEPSKGNEVLSLSIYLPWLLGTFAVSGQDAWLDKLTPILRERPRPLHPVVSGIIIGLVVPWSPQVLFLSLVGVIALAGWSWWVAEPDRRRGLLLRWAVTLVTSLVVASWFVFPLAKGYLTGKVEVVADLWLGSPLVVEPFTILNPHRLVITLIQIAGLLGLAAQIRRVWWAMPVALYLGGVIVERLLMLIRFSATGHAFMLYYVNASIGMALNAIGILTLVQVFRWAWPYLTERAMHVRLLGVMAAAILVGTCGYSAWTLWAPNPRGIKDNATNPETVYSLSMYAHGERLPNGHRVRYSAPKSPLRFPTQQATDFVHNSFGRDKAPDVISANQAIFAFNAWPDWLMPDRVAASGLTRWDYRHGLLKQLATTTDPAAMASGLQNLEFGPVDVLILKVQTNDSTTSWRFADIDFDPQAFAGPQFEVSQPMLNYVVVVRKAG